MVIKDKRIFLLGPTATGKTELIKCLNKIFPIDIISVDSAQIYKFMDIGTAKPNKEELIDTPHHLIDIRNPIESYSVGDFKKDVDIIIEKSSEIGKVPVLCGGTMMYFNAIERPLDSLPISTLETKKIVNDELNEFGIKYLFKKLKNIDPVSAGKINCNDSQRIQRALEVYYISGKPLSVFYTNQIKPEASCNILKIALFPTTRDRLHNVIEERATFMLKNGLIEEVENILRMYPSIDESYSSIRAVGYRQAYHYLKDKISKSDLKDKIIFATRQLAKRQITWMRKMENLDIFEPYSHDLNLKVKSKVEEFLLN